MAIVFTFPSPTNEVVICPDCGYALDAHRPTKETVGCPPHVRRATLRAVRSARPLKVVRPWAVDVVVEEGVR